MEGSPENDKPTPLIPEQMRHSGIIMQQPNNNELSDTNTINKWQFLELFYMKLEGIGY